MGVRMENHNNATIARVYKEVWDEQLELLRRGEITQVMMAGKLGISKQTLNKRLKQFLDPEYYGELPENFFKTRKKEAVSIEKKIVLPDLSEFVK